MKNSLECVKRASSKALLKQLDDKNHGVKVIDGTVSDTSFFRKAKFVYTPPVAINTYEMEYVLEDALLVMKKPITDSMIQVALDSELKETFGYVPKNNLKIKRFNAIIDSIDKPKYNCIAIGKTADTIYHQIGFKTYTFTTISSPIDYYLEKGGLFLVFSLILVILVGVILVLQYLSMLRERKFSVFIKDYTRMIAHDLRTPVTGIQMIFQMLKKNASTETNNKMISDGADLTKKILLNLDNILYVAKSEQKELPVHRTNVDIRTFMENAVKMYRERDFSPKKVSIETFYEPNSFSCIMDAGLMENVICNLLENAIKFTGEIANIIITCKYEKDVVEICFRDNGVGMSEEDQKRVFDIFERGSANDNAQRPGFGIGLHFVQRVIKAHGGKITVKSELNKGTEISIRFFS